MAVYRGRSTYTLDGAMGFLRMLTWSLELIPLVLVDYSLWIAVLLVVATAVVARLESRRAPRSDRRGSPSRWILLLLIIPPVLTLVAGLVLWKRWEVPAFVPLIPQSASEVLVLAFTLTEVAVAIAIAWFRRPIEIWGAAALLFSLSWAWSCGAVSGMAVTGNWL
jgi:hypothetical protein